MKGGLFDLIFIMAMLMILGIGIYVSSYVLDQLPTFESESTTNVLANSRTALDTFNYGFAIIAVGMGLAAVVMAYLLPSHPIMIVAGIIMLVFVMIIAPQISNAFGVFIANENMATQASHFNILNYIMANLPLFLAAFGTMMLIALYMKGSRGVSY